uniref:Uncharacterized protein n=1 Tax=Oryza brachyantha TaxID=4533 RepID=J3MPL4_ORYBR
MLVGIKISERIQSYFKIYANAFSSAVIIKCNEEVSRATCPSISIRHTVTTENK